MAGIRKKPAQPAEPKIVTGLWLANARQTALERARACPVMSSFDGATEYEVFPWAKKARKYYIKLARSYGERLACLVENRRAIVRRNRKRSGRRIERARG